MTDGDDLLTTAVEATLARMSAQKDAAMLLDRRRLAIWRMKHEHGMSAAAITESLRDEFQRRGVTPPKGEGVGYESVAKIIKGRRPEPEAGE